MFNIRIRELAMIEKVYFNAWLEVTLKDLDKAWNKERNGHVLINWTTHLKTLPKQQRSKMFNPVDENKVSLCFNHLKVRNSKLVVHSILYIKIIHDQDCKNHKSARAKVFVFIFILNVRSSKKTSGFGCTIFCRYLS